MWVSDSLFGKKPEIFMIHADEKFKQILIYEKDFYNCFCGYSDSLYV